MSEGPSPDRPAPGMQPPHQNIYQQEAPREPSRRRRRRWLSLGRPPVETPSPAAVVSSGPAWRGEAPPPPRPEEKRRRRRRAGEHSPHLDLINRLTWITVTGVAVAYLVLLAAVEGWRRTHPKPPPSTPVPAAATNAAPAEAARPLEDRIEEWKRGLRMVSDWRKQKGTQAQAEAAGTMAKVLDLIPEYTEARLELALALERGKDYAAARDHLLEVLDQAPGSTEARLALGRVYLARNEPGEALMMARWMIESDPFSNAAHEIAADALLKQNVPAEAVVHLKKLVSLNRDNITLHNNLGMAYLRAGDLRSALQTFKEVLRLDEGNTVAHFNMAVAYAQQGQASNTVDVLTEASRRFGPSFVLTWARGPDFDPVRQDPAFTRFLEQSEPPTAPAPTNAP